MAHGWNSYYQNLSSLSSDPTILSSTPESEGSHPQHIENCIALNDFCGTATSHEPPETNPNYNSSTSGIGNPGSDCVYEKYYGEMPWQTDGDQTLKDYLPKCGNNISDFATDGLSSAGSFPYATDLEGLKQDCEMLPTSFLEDYSDVSSCSDADVGETRPSCKFMSSASVVKSTTSVTTKQGSSKWVLTSTRNMACSADGPCPSMSSEIVSGLTDGEAKENETELLKDNLKTPGRDGFSASDTIRNTGSDTVEGTDDYQHFKHMVKEQRQHTQEDSDLSLSMNENVTDVLEKTSCKNEITQPVSSVFNNEQDNVGTNDGSEDLKRGESSSFKTETFEQEILTCSQQEFLTMGNQDKNTKTNCQDTAPSSDSVCISTSQDVVSELRKDSCQLAEHQPFETIPANNVCISPVISDDYIGDTRDKNEEFTLEDSLSIQATDGNPHQENMCPKMSEKTNTASSSDLDCGSPTSPSDSIIKGKSNHHSESSTKGLDPCLEKEGSFPGEKISTTSVCFSDSGLAGTDGSFFTETKHKESTGKISKTCLKPECPFIEVPSCPEKESATLAENKKVTNATPSTDLDLSSPAGAGDSLSVDSNKSNEQHSLHNLVSCIQPDSVDSEKYPCLQKEAENLPPSDQSIHPSPEQNSSPDKSIHQNPEQTTPSPNQSVHQSPERTTPSPNQSIHQSPERTTPSPNQSIHQSPELTTPSPDQSIHQNPEQNSSPDKPIHQSPEQTTSSPDRSVHQSPERATPSPDQSMHQSPKWTTSSPDHLSFHQSSMITKLENCSKDVDDNAEESFEEFDTASNEESGLDILYSKPLSEDDSSSDMNETVLDPTTFNCDGIKHSERLGAHLKSSAELIKQLHPVVILKTTQPAANEVSEFYCADCQHTTQNVDYLIEHHHSHHSLHCYQFCQSCNVYFLNNKGAEKHLCDATNEDLQPSSGSRVQMKARRLGRHRCVKCKLRFSKLLHYVKHMRTHTGKTPYRCGGCGEYFSQNGCLTRHKRIPGRCKGQTQKDEKPDPVISDIEGPETDPAPMTLDECSVKLYDISKTHICSICESCFLTAKQAKKHSHKHKILALSQKHSNATEEEPLKAEHEAKEKYKCPLCPRLFKYSYNRSRHLRDCVREATYGGKNKVGGKYQCPLCRSTFTIPSNRYRHIKNICLKQYIGQLAKGRTESTQKGEQANPAIKRPKKESSNEQKTTLNVNDSNKQAPVNDSNKQAPVNDSNKQAPVNDSNKQAPVNDSKKQAPVNDSKKQAPVKLQALHSALRYKCNLCPAVFRHPSGKYRHMKKHRMFELTGKMVKYRNSVLSTMPPLTNVNKTTEAKAEERKDNMVEEESKDNMVEEESKDNMAEEESKDNMAEEETTLLSCHFCGKGFHTLKSLKKHEYSHRGEKPYRCLECGKGFKRNSYLITHKITHQRRFQCTVCKKILPTIGELLQHRLSHAKRGMLQCPDCPQLFQYPVYLLRHLATHRNKGQPQPEESAPVSPQNTLDSEEEHDESKQLRCSLCKEIFDDPHILRKHCLTHISGSSRCQCPFCKQTFNSRRYLLRHMLKHTGDKSYSCTNCGKQFYRNLYLRLHREKCLPTQTTNLVTAPQLVVSNKKRPYLCTICPRSFCKKIRLKNHLIGHKKNSLLLCTKCGQYFGNQKLSQHQRNCVQNSDSTVSSTAIGEVTARTSQTSLVVHNKPLQLKSKKMSDFKCTYCPQKFRYKSIYFRHLVSHTGLQPYPCMHCGHRFPSKTSCLQHEAFCDGVKKEELSKDKMDAVTISPNMPTLEEVSQMSQSVDDTEYKCKFCTKTFVKARSLRRHILTHNEVKPYRCKACDSCFSRYDHLKVHQNHCKGKRQRLQVCIPKISFDDVGTGWQSKFGRDPVARQQTFDCKECGRSFPSESKLNRHNTMFHTVKLFTCVRCGLSFSHEKSLKRHKKVGKCKRVTNEINPQSETVANAVHENGSKILQRIQPYFKKYKYVCNFCPRSFKNSWQLKVHTRLHTGEKPYSCNYCGEKFIRNDYVRRHLPKCTMAGQQNTAFCGRCGGLFPKAILEDHKKMCTFNASPGEPTVSQTQQSPSKSSPNGFSCAYCASHFLLFSQLQEHFLNAHQPETAVEPLSGVPLQDHLSNIKEEPLDANYEDRLSDGGNLTCKLTLDSEIPKSFNCPECNMSFASKAGLVGHQRVHISKPPFTCKTCKRGFWNKSLLRNHYRKCRLGKVSASQATQPLESPLKAKIDFALEDSVDSGVLQADLSSADDSAEERLENPEENKVQSSSSEEKKAVQYQCSECEMSFTDGLLLISHLEDHGREEEAKRRNTCPKCGRVCSSQIKLEKHMKLHGIDKKIPCPDCSSMFYTKAELENHRTCHDPNRPYACKLCNQRFWTRPSLCNHYGEEHPKDIFTCRFCKKIYTVKKSLSRHYKKWHQKEQKDLQYAVQEKSNAAKQSSCPDSTNDDDGDDVKKDNVTENSDCDSDSAPYFPCHVCGKTFPTSESLEDHQRCHLGEKPHECEECGKCFYLAGQLQHHQRMHKSEFQCQICGRGFVSLFTLRKHKHTHGKSRPYRCAKCHLSFTGPSTLAEHMSTHSEENFPCDMCDHVFYSKSSRAEHRKSHSQVKSGDHTPPEHRDKSASFSQSSAVVLKEFKYRCGVCYNRYRDPEELSEHGCLADKERPYSCLECKKYFLHASHLKKHRNTHHQSWSRSEYQCNHCNNYFSSSQHFLSHLKNLNAANTAHNTKDEIFICPVCHQCFSSVAELIYHFPMHPSTTFECKLCKMTFSSERSLKDHERCHVTAATEFECAECNQRFLGGDSFRQHNCCRQRVVKKMEQSNSFGKAYSAKDRSFYRNEEEVDVTGEELYVCPHCSMEFYSKSSLLDHQNKQHPNEKPFKCEECGKTFALKKYLGEHMRRHRQKWAAQATSQVVQNQLNCTHCHTKFDTVQDLSIHMRLHAEKEGGDYRCDMCYKSFRQLSLLKLHQESHVGQVVYECTECEKAFAFPHLLEEHQQTHAGSSA